MAKPSLKNKLTADKIEAANKLLIEQNTAEKPVVTEGVSEIVEKPIAIKEKPAKMPKPKAEPKLKVAKSAAKSAPAIEVTEKRLVRVTIDIPEDIHEKLKIKMILTKQTIKDYILNFIETDINKSNLKY